MKFLVWIGLGFCGGVIMARNAATMSAPQTAAVFAAMIIGCGIMWFAGYRGKSVAVATAVATATATANAVAAANARSIASSAIHLYLGAQTGVSPDAIASIVDRSIEELDDVHSSETFHHIIDAKEYQS